MKTMRHVVRLTLTVDESDADVICPRREDRTTHQHDVEFHLTGYNTTHDAAQARSRGRWSKNPLMCNHANECPQTCPCGPDCYCRDHTCRGCRGDAAQPTDRSIDRAAIEEMANKFAEALIEAMRKRGVKV
jgi:hypothetical protein